MKGSSFRIIPFIEKLVSLAPRQADNEAKTADFIIATLERNNVSFIVQSFVNKIPVEKKAELVVDGKKILARSSSFSCGKIKGKDNLISSLVGSQLLFKKANINFNPYSDAISRPSFYLAPSVAVSRKDIPKILTASKVQAEVEIEQVKYQARNILVGNVDNPKIILFAHYDSIETGAVDNASGVGVLAKLVIENPSLVADCLFVFCGSEELSYDLPIYWGYCYRKFQEKYSSLFDKCKKIMVVDSIGNGKTVLEQDSKLLIDAFPIHNIQKFSSKIFVVIGDLQKLMEVYHSDADSVTELKDEYLEEAYNILQALLMNQA